MFSVPLETPLRGYAGGDEVADLVFFAAVGCLVIAAEHLYAATGWAAPGLVDR